MPSDHKIENDIEKYLVKELNKLNIPCEKYKSVHKGDPDRIVFLGEGTVVFIETKVGKNGLSPHQIVRHEYWRNMSYCVFIARTKEDVDKIVSLFIKFKHQVSNENTLGRFVN